MAACARPYLAAVHLAWQGLTSHSVDELGNVHGVCRGSNFSFTEAYYKYDLLWVENDTHGTGIVMLAGDEVQKCSIFWQRIAIHLIFQRTLLNQFDVYNDFEVLPAAPR